MPEYAVQGIGISTNTTIIWATWNDSTSVSTIPLIWHNWATTSGTTNLYYNDYTPIAPTLEQIQAARLRQEQEERDEAEAKERATALLKESLDDAQRDEFERTRTFTVISADGERTYKIRPAWARNVDLIRQGRRVRTYCAHPREDLPIEDTMLAQKLFLESDEETFLRIANVS